MDTNLIANPLDPSHAKAAPSVSPEAGGPFDPNHPGANVVPVAPAPAPTPAPPMFVPVFLPMTVEPMKGEAFTYTGSFNYFLDDQSTAKLAKLLGAVMVIAVPMPSDIEAFVKVTPNVQNTLVFRKGMINAGLVAANWVWNASNPAAALANAQAEVASLV